MKSILDPSFRYTPSFNTDLQKTFARIRRDHQKGAGSIVQPTPDTLAKVSSIVRRTARGRTMKRELRLELVPASLPLARKT
jgi:hypothetical protein